MGPNLYNLLILKSDSDSDWRGREKNSGSMQLKSRAWNPHFLLIWSNAADRRKKHCLCLLICVSTNLANWCIQVFWSMKNHQTLQLETSRQKLEHVLFFEEHVANMLSSAPHYVSPFHTSYFPLWQKALTYIRKKLQRFWQFDSLGLLVLVSLFLSQSFLKIISFQQ